MLKCCLETYFYTHHYDIGHANRTKLLELEKELEALKNELLDSLDRN